jgi:hypothetical protein
MLRPLRFMPWAGALAAAALPPAFAQQGDAGVDRAPERCISLNRVDKTDVIDDRTIVFHMRGSDIYLNHLSRECPGLEREERFMYSPTSNRLCEIDTVTVLEQWGFGLTRGFTCTLGMFHPITMAEFEELERIKEAGGDIRAGDNGQGGFEIVPVEPTDDDAGEPADADDEGADED